MPMLTDRAERRRIAKLDQRVRALDHAISAAGNDLEDLQRRETALAERLAKEEAKKPPEDDAAADAAADALLSDPGASTVTFMERITGSRRKREATMADWRASLKPIKDAIGLAQRKQENAKREIADLQQERAAAWGEYLKAHWEAGMAEFEQRAKAMLHDVVEPLVALEGAMYTLKVSHGPSIHARLMLQELQPGNGIPGSYGSNPSLATIFPSPSRDVKQIDAMRAAAMDRARAELAAERG